MTTMQRRTLPPEDWGQDGWEHEDEQSTELESADLQPVRLEEASTHSRSILGRLLNLLGPAGSETEQGVQAEDSFGTVRFSPARGGVLTEDKRSGQDQTPSLAVSLRAAASALEATRPLNFSGLVRGTVLTRIGEARFNVRADKSVQYLQSQDNLIPGVTLHWNGPLRVWGVEYDHLRCTRHTSHISRMTSTSGARVQEDGDLSIHTVAGDRVTSLIYKIGGNLLPHLLTPPATAGLWLELAQAGAEQARKTLDDARNALKLAQKQGD